MQSGTKAQLRCQPCVMIHCESVAQQVGVTEQWQCQKMLFDGCKPLQGVHHNSGTILLCELIISSAFGMCAQRHNRRGCEGELLATLCHNLSSAKRQCCIFFSQSWQFVLLETETFFVCHADLARQLVLHCSFTSLLV